MIARTKFAALGVLAALLCGVFTAGIASAKKPKPELILREEDAGKKAGKIVATGTVSAGWDVYLDNYPDGVYCSVDEEGPEETMDLKSNGSTKADIATGNVEPPPCYKEVGAGFEKTSLVTITGGSLTEQEMTVKKTGEMDLSAPLIVTVKEPSDSVCAYESKTKLKSAWPALLPEEEPERKEIEEENPFIEDTANLETEPKLKLDKSASKGTCAKTEEGYIEAWLGPVYHEYEADLT